MIDNIIHYAMRHYDNIHCKTAEDFNSDLNILIYIKKLLCRIQAGESVNNQLVLNHIITFYNVFDLHAATVILFTKIEQDKWSLLKTFLLKINTVPEFIPELQLDTTNIKIISSLADELEKM